MELTRIFLGGTQVPELNVSYKPQMIAPKFEGTVRQLLHSRIPDAYIHPQFVSDVMKPMLMDHVRFASGGRTLSGRGRLTAGFLFR
jgi:ATP-binding cassette subfamily E protein 1